MLPVLGDQCSDLSLVFKTVLNLIADLYRYNY